MLRTGARGRDVLAVSREMISRWPGRALLGASVKELASVDGVGEAKAASLLAAAELARRLDRPESGGGAVRSAEQALAYLHEIRDKKREHFVGLYLDARNCLLHKEFLFIGTLNATLAHPREVYEPALRCQAASVILAHNHPSGDPSPSPEDILLTMRLKEAGNILGIKLLDHVILSKRGFSSLQERCRL